MPSLIELLKRYKPQSDEDFMQQAAADEMFPPQRWTGDGVDMGKVTPMPKKVDGGALWPVAIMDDGSRELDWGEGITGAAYDAFTAPKRAYDGEFDPMSDEGIGEAFNMAGMLMGGGFGRAAAKGPTSELGAFGAWHGSPHDFKKFDLSRLGTGEGNDAFGSGLYFASSPDVAEHYRKLLTPMSSADPHVFR